MKLTREQSRAVLHDGNALITACPGSGKTRTLIAKLICCLDQVRDTSRRICCITYTNGAVYEIESRLRLYGATGDEDYCEVSTIHAFCLNNILRYHYWRVPPYKDGFKVVPPDDDRFKEIARNVCAEYGIAESFQESFEQINRDPDGTPIVPSGLTGDMALNFWGRLLKEKLIDFPNIIYYSYTLLQQYPSIAQTLACKFAWFLIDEFQDTTSLQVEILKCIAENQKTKFFLVGDPYQSIYGFAGAHPDLMPSFANHIKAADDFKLLDNFRSSKLIVNHAEKLFPREPPMCSVGEFKDFPEEPQYVHSPSVFEAITSYFIPALKKFKIDYGSSAILAPQWIPLYGLGRQLREYGIPIVGPGARPYRRIHVFALLAEQIAAYLDHPSALSFYRIERELFNLLNNITNTVPLNVYTHKGKVVIYRLLNSAQKIKEGTDKGIYWLESCAKNFTDILIQAEFLTNINANSLKESVSGMKADMLKNRVDISKLNVAALGVFASHEKNMKLLTMHRAKGTEFDAVALIDVHEGKLPHYYAKTDEQIEESKRLFYVAVTRAKRVLMYITDSGNARNTPSRFLQEVGVVDT